MPRILFIEDEPDHIALYKTKLEMEGFEFVSALNSQEALEAIARGKPDLILLDILLPGEENGLDILDKLKKNAGTKTIPTVVFTNFDEKEFKERASNLGANDFVLKAEVTPQEMVDKIREILK
jgi:two-component system phosphate regulon response regulator PhoB